MSFERLPYDPCSYEEKLRQSTGPGMYAIGQPAADCAPQDQDIPADPFLRYQAWGPGSCAPGSAVDVSSDLLGLPRKNTKCAADEWTPGKGVKNACAPKGARDPRAYMAPTESTRLSNPPCSLRGTGWNRWEWLCYDPQDKAIVPFEWNVNYRIVAKDNHKPCVETPMDQTATLPSNVSGVDPSQAFANWTITSATPAQLSAPAYMQACEDVTKATRGPSQ